MTERPTFVPLESPSIYMASKARHAPMWIGLRNEGWNIISKWIDVWEKGAIEDWSSHWEGCIHEAARAQFTIAFVLRGEDMKGALVEVGAALAWNRTVIFVGETDYLAEKRYTMFEHPLVVTMSSLDGALAYIEQRRRPPA